MTDKEPRDSGERVSELAEVRSGCRGHQECRVADSVGTNQQGRDAITVSHWGQRGGHVCVRERIDQHASQLYTSSMIRLAPKAHIGPSVWSDPGFESNATGMLRNGVVLESYMGSVSVRPVPMLALLCFMVW